VLRIARTDPPELAFIKLGDQDINGFYISRELKKINPKVKIVFIANTDYYAVEAFLEDADDYLLWPVNQERLNKCFHKIGL
jgi:two-component SAPR family response regulator